MVRKLVFLSEDDAARLRQLAKEQDRTESAVVRVLIRTAKTDGRDGYEEAQRAVMAKASDA